MTREEAIAILDGFKHNPLFNEQHFEALDMAISALSAPSANVISIDQANAMIKSYVSHYEENKGEWIAYDHGMGLVYLKCPFCGMTIDKRYVEHNFCGKCGAKLSGEKSGFER
jgi:hypothetical protein